MRLKLLSSTSHNPERAGLVKPDCCQEYPYTGCLVPGYPELQPWQPDYWERFGEASAYLPQHGLLLQVKADKT